MRRTLGCVNLNNIFHSKNKTPHLIPNALSKKFNKNNWSVPAGKNKKFLARPKVKVNFKGTTTKYKISPNANKAQKEWIKQQIATKEKRNKKTFEDALFLLSQSDTGRDILKRMTKAGYVIEFDESRTSSMGAGGLCDPSSKKIILAPTTDAEYLALVIGHEAVHALQYTVNDIFPNSSHTPQTAIKLSFSIEADAYAQQTQIALELAYGSPYGPKNQFKTKGPLQQMRKRFKNIVEAAEKTLTKEENLNNGAAVAAAFEAFFDSITLRSFYEDNHINWINFVAPQIIDKFDELGNNFQSDIKSEEIIKKLKHKGKSYLKEHAPNIDMNDSKHSGLTKTTQKQILKFYKKYMPNSKIPKLKTYGKHINNAKTVIFGHRTGLNVILMNRPNYKKPPNRKF